MGVRQLKVLARRRALKGRSAASKSKLIELLRESDAQSDRVSAAAAVGELEPAKCGEEADNVVRWSPDCGARLIHLITACNLRMCEDLKLSLKKYSADKKARLTKERLLELYANSERKKDRTQLENKLGDYELYWNCVHELYNNPMFKPVHFDKNDPNLQGRHGLPLFDPANFTGQQPLKKLQHYYCDYRSAYAKASTNYSKSGSHNPNFADFVGGRTLIYYLHLGLQGGNGDIIKGIFSSGMPCHLEDVKLLLGSEKDKDKSLTRRADHRAKRKLRDMTVADLMHVFNAQAASQSGARKGADDDVEKDLARSVLEDRLFMLYDRLDTASTRKKARRYLEAEVSKIERRLGMGDESEDESDASASQ